MTPSGESDIGVQRAAELLTGQREFWTVLELEAPQGWIVSMTLVQRAHNAADAAARSAGWQMPRDWRPRRIQVHEKAPHVFEWVQVEPYLCAVGREISGP